MKWLPFFGNDDSEKESVEDADVTIQTNVDDSNINIFGAETTETTDAGGMTVHTISVSSDDDATPTPEDPGSSRRSAPTPSSPTGPPSTPTPETDPEPSGTKYDRGTFVFPNDKDFMQKLGARAKNGHGSIVETVYVLTGPSYTRPTDLIRLDNDSYYGSATKTSVSFDPKSMAEKVAGLYPDEEPPRLIARFHTHPGGTLRPSSADKRSAPTVWKSFVDAFGTDDFEFFQGIHGLAEHGRDPGPAERHAPTANSGHIRWLGERYKHKVALFDREFGGSKRLALE